MSSFALAGLGNWAAPPQLSEPHLPMSGLLSFLLPPPSSPVSACQAAPWVVCKVILSKEKNGQEPAAPTVKEVTLQVKGSPSWCQGD